MKKPEILLVEDEENFGDVLQGYIRLGGYDVHWCKNGEEGWKAFGERNFELIILDVMMPRIDGFSLAEKIRRKDTETPIIFLTARGKKEDQVRGYRCGADEYLAKPFDSEILLIKIDILLKRRKKGAAEPDHFEIGHYRFHHPTRTLSNGEGDQRLSPREADLLRMLCLYEGQLLTRSKALLDIWGDDSYFNSRSMDVYIAKLRKYLERDERISIQTLHGSGYQLMIRDSQHS